jgi:hypothetical protein
MSTNPYRVLLGITASVMLTLMTASAGTAVWTGQGSDSLRCDKVGESSERPDEGWIHWVVTQASDITNPQLVLGGTGNGSFGPAFAAGGSLHFFTPYFDLDGLIATLHYDGELGANSQFVISDWCPGVVQAVEHLTVTKTVNTFYKREHYWDIDKSVETENDHELNGYPKVWLFIDGTGDERATWTVDVTYEGYDDKWHKVYGDIEIVNSGTLDALITDISDVLGGIPINIECEVEVPYLLEIGQSFTCTYSYQGYVEGNNVATVETELNPAGYTGQAPIVWGDPTNEINKTVEIKDISDLFGEDILGTVTAPNGETFTYDHDFAWEKYGADGCGSFTYENTASIVETGQEASATLKVNVQCFIYETAFAKGNDAECFIPTFSNWGWTNPLGYSQEPQKYKMELWAAAGQCDTSKGTLVGKVIVTYGGDTFNVVYKLDDPYILKEKHVYAGVDKFPHDQRGRRTVAPGQYYISLPGTGPIFVIAHGVVGIPDPKFGP